MKKFLVLPSALALAAVLVASVGARSTDAPPAVVHSHVHAEGVSDPDPNDCFLCAGDPQTHVRALWAIQKEVARVYALRLL